MTTDNDVRTSPEAELAKARIKGFWDQYQYYNSSLRGWLIAFGVGSLALMITEATAFGVLSIGEKRVFVAMLAVGTVLQIIAALLNKYYNLAAFHASQSPKRTSTQDAVFLKIGAHPGRDLLVDVVTLASFFIATIWLVVLAVK